MSPLSQPGGGQRGGAQAEVWEALQRGDRNPPEGCSQLYDRPRQGRGYNPPSSRASQVHPSEVEISHCLCAPRERDVLFKVSFHLPRSIYKGSAFFSHLPLHVLSGRYIKGHQAPLCSTLSIPTLTCFPSSLHCLLNVDVFKTATPGQTVSRRGTSSTRARLGRGAVITSYVSSCDVLLTAIDFQLFIFTLRIWSPHLSFNPKLATKFDLTVFLPGISELVNLLPPSHLCGHTSPHHTGKLPQP